MCVPPSKCWRLRLVTQCEALNLRILSGYHHSEWCANSRLHSHKNLNDLEWRNTAFGYTTNTSLGHRSSDVTTHPPPHRKRSLSTVADTRLHPPKCSWVQCRRKARMWKPLSRKKTLTFLKLPDFLNRQFNK